MPHGTQEQVAEKVVPKVKLRSAAKAAVLLLAFTARLKPSPFKATDLSEFSCKL